MKILCLLGTILLISCSSQDSEKHEVLKTAPQSSEAQPPEISSSSSTLPKVTVSSSSSSESASSSSKTLPVYSAAAADTVKPASGIVVGKLRWMSKNLNVKTKGSFCYQQKNENCRKYGRLYTFEEARKICPAGWRLPTDAEWTETTQLLGENDGQKLKSKFGWANDEGSSGNGSDSIGFQALPSGIVYEGDFMYLGHHAYFWTATARDSATAYYRSLSYDASESYRYYNFKTAGYAVRCVQNAD